MGLLLAVICCRWFHLGQLVFPKLLPTPQGWSRCLCNSCHCSSFAWAHTFLTKVLQTPWSGPVHIYQQSPPIALHGPVTCSTLLPMVSLGPICFPKVAADALGWARFPCNSCCCNSITWAHTILTKVLQTPWGGLVHMRQQPPPMTLYGPVTCRGIASRFLQSNRPMQSYRQRPLIHMHRSTPGYLRHLR